MPGSFKNMRRFKKLLPNKYFLDENFYTLKTEIFRGFEEDQKKFNGDVYKMFGQTEPKEIIKEIIFLVLSSIRPKYNLKEKKFY